MIDVETRHVVFEMSWVYCNPSMSSRFEPNDDELVLWTGWNLSEILLHQFDATRRPKWNEGTPFHHFGHLASFLKNLYDHEDPDRSPSLHLAIQLSAQ